MPGGGPANAGEGRAEKAAKTPQVSIKAKAPSERRNPEPLPAAAANLFFITKLLSLQ
jgi:hypothetical protein